MSDADKFVKGEKVQLTNGNHVWWDKRLQAVVREQPDDKGEKFLVMVYNITEEKARKHLDGLVRAME